MTVQDQYVAPQANTEQDTALLELTDLKMYFPVKTGVFRRTTGHIRAVDGVSLQVRAGEVLGLVGESGCGKSTLGRTIIRLYEPTAGSIRFAGQDVSRLPERDLKAFRRDVQMVFQDPYSSLNPRKTIETILTEPFKVHGLLSRAERRERVEQLMLQVGLEPSLRNRHPHEFSGGQRQRIGIARSLALKPRLIIGDEPVSALDVSIQSQVLNIMADLQRDLGLTYLFIAHDLAVVKHIADRIGVMYLGHLVELADKSALYRNPLHPYTRSLMSAIPKSHPRQSDGDRIILQGELPSPSNPPGGCVFHTRCPRAMDHCRQVKPTLKVQSSGHQVACHLYD